MGGLPPQTVRVKHGNALEMKPEKQSRPASMKGVLADMLSVRTHTFLCLESYENTAPTSTTSGTCMYFVSDRSESRPANPTVRTPFRYHGRWHGPTQEPAGTVYRSSFPSTRSLHAPDIESGGQSEETPWAV